MKRMVTVGCCVLQFVLLAFPGWGEEKGKKTKSAGAGEQVVESKIVFYVPFDGDLKARMSLMEVEPVSGSIIVEDKSQSVTLGELAKGRDIVMEGGELEGKGGGFGFSKGLQGKAIQVKSTVGYRTPWMQGMKEGSMVVWYRNPHWRPTAWNIPAMVTPAQAGRSKPAAFQNPLSHWIFDRMTSPQEQGLSRWYDWDIVNNEHPRNISTRDKDDDGWHCWAMTWGPKGIQVFDDGEARDITKYSSRIPKGQNHWEDHYMGRNSIVYEDPSHIKLDEILSGKLHLGRFCQVDLDELYVWNKALSQEEVKGAVQRAKEGKSPWPDEMKPVPKYKSDSNLDYGATPQDRPPLPARVQWGDKGAWIQENDMRKLTCLNGYWRFQPADSRFDAPDPKAWGYMRLPGFIPVSESKAGKGKKSAIGKNASKLVVYDGAFEPAEDDHWGNRPLDSYQVFWFERDVEIPADQKGWRFFLNFDRVENNLPVIHLFVNGKFVKTIKSYGPGHVDITDAIKPGSSNRLTMVVENTRELTFDWYLDARKCAEVSTHNLFLNPQWRKKSIGARFDLENHTDKAQTYTYAVDFFEAASGKKVHSIPGKKITLEPGAKGEFEVEGEWKDAHGWSVYDPFLHHAQLVIRNVLGQEVDRGNSVRFGYREFWVDKGVIYLNGSLLHNRGIGQSCGNMGYHKAVNYADLYNEALAFFSMHRDVNTLVKREINRVGADSVLDAADETGFIAAPIEHGTNYAADQLWNGNKEEQARNTARARWLRNHPSIMMHIVRQTANYEQKEGVGGGLGEYKLWFTKFEEDASWLPYQKVWEDFVEPMRREHPGVFYSCLWLPYGGQLTPRLSKHGYGMSLQSQEEEPRFFVGQGPAAYVAESGWPQISRNYGDVSGVDDLKVYYEEYWPNSSQITDEFGAICFGDKVYDPDVAIPNAMGGGWKGDADGTTRFSHEYVKDIETVGRPFSRKSKGVRASPGWYDLRSLFMTGMMKTWRWYNFGWWEHTETETYFASRGDKEIEKLPTKERLALRGPGILLDYGNAPETQKVIAHPREVAGKTRFSQLGEKALKGQQALVSWIYGWPDIAQKDHAFYSGERIRKQIGILNEYPQPTRVMLAWKAVQEDGRELASGKMDVPFETGAQKLLPIDFMAPKVNGKMRGHIELQTSLDGKVVHDDRFEFQVFPEHKKPELSGNIALIDSEATGSMLRIAGISYTPVSEKTDLSKYDLLIIGRQADPEKLRMLLKKLDLKKHLDAGLNLLVFEQDALPLDRPIPDPWPALALKQRPDRPELANMGMRMEHTGDRYAFVRNPDHPVLQGITNEDLANWRGASNLMAPWSSPKWMGLPDLAAREWREPQRSNFGEVATFVYEKPQGGNLTSLVDNSFDLLYSSLIEEKRAKGRTVICQLNVTNRYKADPAATRLVDNLLKYMTTQSEGPTGEAILVGSDAWKKALEHLPFDLPVTKDENKIQKSEMVIVGIGTPRVETFDEKEKGKFTGTEAAPVGEKDATLEWLRDNRKMLADYVEKGGSVMVLAAQDSKDLGWLPFEVKLEKTSFFAAKPNGVVPGIGPSELYYRRTADLMLPVNLPKGGKSTIPALVSRIPHGKGEFILCQVEPKQFFGNWSESKITRLLSAILTEKGVADRHDLNLMEAGYGPKGFPYWGRTLYFDPFISTSW